MADITAPSSLPEFASGAEADFTEPSESKKALGWIKSGSPAIGEKPPLEYFNWIHRLTYQWILWLKSNFENFIGTTDDETCEIGILKDITPTKGQVILTAASSSSNNPLAIIHPTNFKNGSLLLIRPTSAWAPPFLIKNGYGATAGTIQLKNGDDLFMNYTEDSESGKVYCSWKKIPFLLLTLRDNVWYEIATNCRRGTNRSSGYLPRGIAEAAGLDYCSRYSPIREGAVLPWHLITSDRALNDVLCINGRIFATANATGKIAFVDMHGSDLQYVGNSALTNRMCTDGRSIFVTTVGSSSLLRYRIDDPTVVDGEAVLTYSGLGAVALTENDEIVGVYENNDQVFFLNPNNLTTSATTIVGDYPIELCVAGKYVFVSNHGDSTISKLDAVTHLVTATINTTGVPNAISTDGIHLFVDEDRAGTHYMVVYDLSGTELSAIEAPANEHFRMYFDGAKMWCSLPAAGLIHSFDPATWVFNSATPIARPGAAGVSGDGHFLYSSSNFGGVYTIQRHVVGR